MMLSLKTTVATIVVPGTACILVPYYILKASHVSLTPTIGLGQIFACLIMACGLFMILWVSTAFVRKGQGTPIPINPPTRLIIQGLYRYVRNPMYVGAILVVLSEVIYFHSGWLVVYAVGLWAALHTALVIFEEPQLRHRFGVEYEQYLSAVPRWIPKIPARTISPDQS
jgi:protein-S-isoprenylcysteine O-methyltransferase Ste14